MRPPALRRWHTANGSSTLRPQSAHLRTMASTHGRPAFHRRQSDGDLGAGSGLHPVAAEAATQRGLDRGQRRRHRGRHRRTDAGAGLGRLDRGGPVRTARRRADAARRPCPVQGPRRRDVGGRALCPTGSMVAPHRPGPPRRPCHCGSRAADHRRPGRRARAACRGCGLRRARRAEGERVQGPWRLAGNADATSLPTATSACRSAPPRSGPMASSAGSTRWPPRGVKRRRR